LGSTPRCMEVLSGAAAGDRPAPLPPPPGRRYLRRQASLALTPSNMFLFRPPKPTYVATSWPGELCVLVRVRVEEGWYSRSFKVCKQFFEAESEPCLARDTCFAESSFGKGIVFLQGWTLHSNACHCHPCGEK